MRRRFAAPALALAVLVPAGPATARPHVSDFSIAVPRGARAAAAGGVAVYPGRRFDLLGLRWRGSAPAREARVQVRVHGRWGRWVPLDVSDIGPDGAGPTHGTDPAWVGGADALRLKWRGAPRHLRVHFVRITHRPRLPRLARTAQAGEPPAIYPRSAWDPSNQCPPRTTPQYGIVEMALVHHTVTTNDYGPGDSPSMILAICRYHRNSNGWNDIGYNFLVDKYGQLFEGRAGGIDQPVVGAQAQGFNDQSTSVSNLGTFTSAPESDAAINAMADLLAWKLPLEGVPVDGTVTLTSEGGSLNRWPAGRQVTFDRISGHRDAGKTECPGNALYDQLPELRDLTAARVGQFAPAGPPPDAGSVSLQAAATSLVYPDPAQLSGTLTGAGTVSIQVQSAGRYVTIAHATPGPDGAWSLPLPLNRGHVLRALQVLPDGRAGATSPSVRVTVTPALTASAPRRVLAGGLLRLRGTIGPQRRALSLSLQVVSGGRLVRIARLPLIARGGSFATRLRLRRPGLYRLYVRYAGDVGTRPAWADAYVRAVRHRGSLHRGPGGLNGGSAAPAG